MATCTGLELTGGPVPVNHQNAFPLRWSPRHQDGGAPTPDIDPVTQIRRLSMWDNSSDKLMQMNHPNLMQVLGDRDHDGQADEGFRKMLDYVDVVEVNPLNEIFRQETTLPEPDTRGNVIFNWLQLLNQGYRIPGVVNTDAHHNFHGSGWLRNFVKSSTDDPSHIDVAEMVKNSRRGRIVMSNGPFMTVEASGTNNGSRVTAGVGELAALTSGEVTLHVRIQSPNWLDINRVQVFVNGRPQQSMNFTRRANGQMFGSETVKFDQNIQLNLQTDAHIIVAACGEGLELGRVMGPAAGQLMPAVVSNPIFIDCDQQAGFTPNKDALGAPITLSNN
jgi:hypothetical protein